MAASFCSNKPDVGCGRIDRIIIADRLCRWMDQFPIPSSLAMLPRFCCSFFFLFFLPGYLAISKETPGCCPPLAFIPRLFFSLSVILWFKLFCLILLFLFGLRWDIYLFLPEKRVPFQSHSAVPCLPTKFYHATPLCSPSIRPGLLLLSFSPPLLIWYSHPFLPPIYMVTVNFCCSVSPDLLGSVMTEIWAHEHVTDICFTPCALQCWCFGFIVCISAMCSHEYEVRTVVTFRVEGMGYCYDDCTVNYVYLCSM